MRFVVPTWRLTYADFYIQTFCRQEISERVAEPTIRTALLPGWEECCYPPEIGSLVRSIHGDSHSINFHPHWKKVVEI